MKVVASFIGAGLGLLALPSALHAEEDNWDGGYSLQATRRSGFAATINLGYGLGSVSGYPNEVSKIGDPAYESSTGATLGSTLSLWLGGALRDWFTVGVGLMTLGAQKGDITGGGGAFIIHVEGFPLWSMGGPFRDLSTYANFGAGSLGLTGGPEDADGGLVSVLGGGVGYELWRVGYFAFGPAVEGTYMYSPSAEAYGMFAAFRGSFYGGP